MNKSRKGTMARLMEYITARHKREFALVIICILISVVAAMVGNSLMQVIIDDYILEMVETGEDLFGGLLRIVLVMAAVYLAGALGTLFYNRVIAIVGQKVLKEIRDDLFVKMQTFPISFFDSHTHGDIMSVYTNDTDTLRQFIAQSLPMMISSLVTILFAFCFMLRFNLILTAIVAALSAVMVLTARAMVRYSSKYFSRQQDSTGAVNGYIEEMFGGLKVVKVFCHEEAAKARLRELNEELYSNALRANGAAGAMMPVMSGFRQPAIPDLSHCRRCHGPLRSGHVLDHAGYPHLLPGPHTAVHLLHNPDGPADEQRRSRLCRRGTHLRAHGQRA